MRGTVGSLREKREAKKAAQRVFGVISVDNQLQVKLMNDEKGEDAELRGDVLQALMWAEHDVASTPRGRRRASLRCRTG